MIVDMSDIESSKPLLLKIYERYLDDQDTAKFVIDAKHRYTTGTLERLAHETTPEIRRAAIYALGFVGDFSVNHTVGKALSDDDPVVRSLASIACRSVWNRSGSKQQQLKLIEIIRFNATGKFHDAANTASALIEEIPSFAEAWYHRGSAWFQLNDFRQANHFCNQTLELNPYHFVAAHTMGEAYLRLFNPVGALDAFRRALRVNPGLESLHDKVNQLSRRINDQ